MTSLYRTTTPSRVAAISLAMVAMGCTAAPTAPGPGGTISPTSTARDVAGSATLGTETPMTGPTETGMATADPSAVTSPATGSPPGASSGSPPPEGQQAVASEGREPVINDSFISPLVEMFGDVRIGSHSFVAGNTTLRADPGGAICLGSESNLQDNILMLALLDRPNTHDPAECGDLSASSGDRTSVAHQATITNSTLGDFVFVGFRAEIRDSIVEDGAFILHGAFVEGVTIPADSLVAIGQRVTTQEDADALSKVTDAENAFKVEVLEVNAEFAEKYVELYEEEGHASVIGVSQAPATEWNPDPVTPTLGDNVVLEPFARIVGDVRLGADSTVGRRSSIRADEGAPITVGPRAEIEDRVTFHALKGTTLTIGSALDTDDNVTFHGPLTVGDRLTIGDDAVLFRSEVGDNVTIGERALVVGVTLPDGINIPPDAVITTQGQVDALLD